MLLFLIHDSSSPLIKRVVCDQRLIRYFLSLAFHTYILLFSFYFEPEIHHRSPFGPSLGWLSVALSASLLIFGFELGHWLWMFEGEGLLSPIFCLLLPLYYAKFLWPFPLMCFFLFFFSLDVVWQELKCAKLPQEDPKWWDHAGGTLLHSGLFFF